VQRTLCATHLQSASHINQQFMILQGKGFFITNISDCEGGEPTSILAAALEAGLSHVIVQIADGERAFGVDASGHDFTAPVVQGLRSAGIAVWGWHSIHGINPNAEATTAIERVHSLGLDGYVVKADDEFKRPRMAITAHQFMTTIRAALEVPIALDSYRFPHYHSQFPWSKFLEFCDLHMPQVTWEGAHNAGEQLRESKRQCDALPHAKPYIPTGATYAIPGWSPTVEEINDFLNTAEALGILGINFFNWEQCRNSLPLVWETIATFNWPAEPLTNSPVSILTTKPESFLPQFLAALNSQQADLVTALYDQDATQVWADRVLHSAAAIHSGYEVFFGTLPAGTVFNLSHAQLEEDQYRFSWNAGSISGETTLVLKNGRIILDYTFIS
jgi:hypothetical protein